jgi:hypothetical protein
VRKSASFTEQNWWQFCPLSSLRRLTVFDPRAVEWKNEHGMADRMSQGRGCPLGVSHHFLLLPEFAGKDVLRNESVDTAHEVHDLGDAEAHRNATESESI